MSARKRRIAFAASVDGAMPAPCRRRDPCASRGTAPPPPLFSRGSGGAPSLGGDPSGPARGNPRRAPGRPDAAKPRVDKPRRRVPRPPESNPRFGGPSVPTAPWCGLGSARPCPLYRDCLHQAPGREHDLDAARIPPGWKAPPEAIAADTAPEMGADRRCRGIGKTLVEGRDPGGVLEPRLLPGGIAGDLRRRKGPVRQGTKRSRRVGIAPSGFPHPRPERPGGGRRPAGGCPGRTARVARIASRRGDPRREALRAVRRPGPLRGGPARRAAAASERRRECPMHARRQVAAVHHGIPDAAACLPAQPERSRRGRPRRGEPDRGDPRLCRQYRSHGKCFLRRRDHGKAPGRLDAQTVPVRPGDRTAAAHGGIPPGRLPSRRPHGDRPLQTEELRPGVPGASHRPDRSLLLPERPRRPDTQVRRRRCLRPRAGGFRIRGPPGGGRLRLLRCPWAPPM